MTTVLTKPLEPPLPDGRDGTSVRLHPLLSGEVLAPLPLLERRTPFSMARAIGVGLPKSRRVWIPAPVFLIEHPGAGGILVDTGVHPRAPLEPRRTMGVASSWLYEFRSGPDGDLPSQLRARGVQPTDVRIVVMTHLHTDHASAATEFPRATFVVDRREWAAANRRPGFANGYDARHFAHPFDWRLVDFDAPGAAPTVGFDSALDLFGDGTVRLVATPGHTPGHMSVLVLTAEREVLLSADAAYTQRTINECAMPGIAHSRRQFRASLGQIQRFRDRRPDALVITGHDREQWPTLKPIYG